MTYVIWTPAEIAALCKALAHCWLKYGAKAVDPNNYHTLIALAGEGLQEADSVLAANGDWRVRVLKPRDARAFIEKHREVLTSLMDSGENRGYLVEGYEQPLTIKQMQDEIVRLNAELKKHLTPPPAPPTPAAPLVTRPKVTEPYVTITQKTRVAIAGLHDKHRENIVRRFPQFAITWIEPHDNDAQIKAKASGRTCIACTFGTNGNVLRLLHNISPKCFTVGGASGVRDTLANIH